MIIINYQLNNLLFNSDRQSKEDQQKLNDAGSQKKSTSNNAFKSQKIDILGESTTDKDTEDETEKKSMPKVTDETKSEDIEKVTEDLQLSEDDSDDTIVDSEIIDQKKKNWDENNLTGDTSCVEKVKQNLKGDEVKCETQFQEVSLITKAEEPNNELNNTQVEDTENIEPISEIPPEELIEVEDLDDYLMYLEDILKNIHRAYYEEYDLIKKEGGSSIPDLKVVIPNVKKQVLKKCHLVFSGLVPSHIPLQQSRAYLVAISLGATVSPDISPGCTHLVAARPGTAKVNSSRRQKGIIIVTPLWLWHCAERWERLDERLYPLGEYF